MCNNTNYCVILAGGMGSKLWPLSRVSKPKQFIDVEDSGRSLLRHTFDRFLRILPTENIIVVTSEQYVSLVREQLPELPEQNILPEPYSRNTAPSIAYATYSILLRCPDAKIVVTPSDNSISSRTEFSQTVLKVLDFISENDYIVTLGIVPTRPDTNFGYIQMTGGQKSVDSELPVKVKTFTEKPDAELAGVFVESGEFLWNSGVIIAHADTLRREIERNNPDLTRLFAGWEGAIGTPFEKDFIYKVYTDCTSRSFDYSILDKTENAWVQPCHFNWMDIGNWGSIYNSYPDKDKDGNAVIGCGKFTDDCSDNLVVSTDKKKLIAIKGLENFMVIDTPDSLLICPRDSKDFKEVISQLGMPGYENYR